MTEGSLIGLGKRALPNNLRSPFEAIDVSGIAPASFLLTGKIFSPASPRHFRSADLGKSN